MSRTDPLGLAVHRISRDAPSEHVCIGGEAEDVCTNLAADSTGIAARLGAYRAFCLGRSGLLSLVLLWWGRCDGSPRGGGRIMHCSGGE